ncbi:hypothetical protein [Streptomyces sp. NBC_01615]|uniref:hypothetical protein n=1 Tax=Streptomyces sp. NBC_01615 TaxID=2975898 RepID=UPI00386719AC
MADNTRPEGITAGAEQGSDHGAIIVKGLTERRDCRNASPIPKAAGSLPLLGHAIPLMRDNLAFIARLRDYGPFLETERE